MVIGIDASRANRPHKTGTEWYSYYLIRQFARLDKKNQYILYSDTPLTGGLLNLSDECGYKFNRVECGVDKISYDKNGFQVIKSQYNNFRAKILKWPFKYFWTQGRLSLEMVCCKPDILFIPAHTLPLVHPKHSITTIHDVGFARDINMYDCGCRVGPESKRIHRAANILARICTCGTKGANTIDYLDWSTKFALKHASKVITISDFSKREIMDIYGARYEKKITVVYNGFNDALYRRINDKKQIAVVLQKYDIDSKYIFYIGRLEKKKNIHTLIEAYALMRTRNHEFKNYKLVLAGDAGFGYSDINYLISELDLENEVIIPGWVDEADVPYLYNGAEAFVFPSLYEGFGIPILQAMACGIPVAASSVASIPEVAGDAVLLFDPKNPEPIANALSRILKEGGLKRRLTVAGIERAAQFSWEKCAKDTLDVIIKSKQ